MGLTADANMGTFVHEWAHVEDFHIDSDRYNKELIGKDLDLTSHSWTMRALRSAGIQLERRFFSELNAADAETRLSWSRAIKDRSLGSLLAFDHWAYRATNELNVGMGRLLINPFNPKGYINLAKFITIVPTVLFFHVVLPSAAAFGGVMLVEFMVKWFVINLDLSPFSSSFK